jgi:hypothetical protein
MWYTFWMTNRWLLLNFDALGALAVLTTTLFALSGLVNAGLAGLSITSAMAFTMSVYWACRYDFDFDILHISFLIGLAGSGQHLNWI